MENKYDVVADRGVGARDAEVEELRCEALVIGREEDVLRFEIAMDDSGGMRGGEALARFTDDLPEVRKR